MSIGKKIVGSAAWSFLGKLLTQIINFITFVVLARVLDPADFGLFGLVLVILSFVTVLSEVGFHSALVQNDEVSESDWATLFWVGLIIGFVFAGVMAGVAPLAAWFYEDQRVLWLTIAVGLQMPISALSGTHLTIIKREMRFDFLAKMDIAAEIGSGIVAIILALNGFGAWSLVGKAIAFYTMRFIVTWSARFWRPSMVFDMQMLRDNFDYSIGFFKWNFTHLWSRNIDNVIIGKILGNASLGLYTRAYTTMLMPLRQTNAVAAKVMFSGLSRIQHDKVQVKETYLRAVAMISLLGFPSMFGLAVVCRDFVLALYGPKWIGCVEVLQLLCLVGAIETMTNSTSWLFMSQGRTDILAKWGVFASIMLTIAFGVGAYAGSIDFVGFSYMILACLIFPWPLFKLVGGLVDMRPGEVVLRIGPQAICAGIMAGCVTVVGHFLPATMEHWLRLLIQVVVGALIYPLCLHLAKSPTYIEARDFVLVRLKARLKNKLKRFKKPKA